MEEFHFRKVNVTGSSPVFGSKGKYEKILMVCETIYWYEKYFPLILN